LGTPETIGDNLWNFTPENNSAIGTTATVTCSVEYDEARDMLYLAYFDDSNRSDVTNVSLITYNLTTKTWGDPYKFPNGGNTPAGQSWISPYNYFETHMVIETRVDTLGYIWLTWGGHYTSTYPYRSMVSNYPISSPYFQFNSSGNWGTFSTIYGGSPGAYHVMQVVNASHDFEIGNPPTANLTITSTAGLNASLSISANDSDGSIAYWILDTGDNNTYTGNAGTSFPSYHVYSSNGTYGISLKVYDDSGRVSYNNTTVSVPFDYYFNVIDNGTAEMMKFANTTYGTTQWVLFESNPLILTNNGDTIDGDNSYIIVLPPEPYNDSVANLIGSNITDFKCYAKINNGAYREITLKNTSGGYFIISDDSWIYDYNYTFASGYNMTIKFSVKVYDYDDAGYYNSSTYPGWWDVAYNGSRTHTGDYFNASLNISSTSNTPPITPYDPFPANNSVNATVYPAIFNFKTGDADADTIDAYVYISGGIFNNTLIGHTQVVNTSLSKQISIVCPYTLSYSTNYSWYVNVTDGINYTLGPTWNFNTAASSANTPPLVFDPFPQNNSVNISLIPTLSITVYDNDSNNISVYFYDNNGFLLGADTFINQMPPSPMQFIASWNDATTINHTYYWYAIANDGDGNEVRYPSTGYLSFTTGLYTPPSIIFHVVNASATYQGIYGVNISCTETLDYKITDIDGKATMTFNYDDIGETYHFHFVDNSSKYKNYDTAFTIPPDQGIEYVTLTPKTTYSPPADYSQYDMWADLGAKIAEMNWSMKH